MTSPESETCEIHYCEVEHEGRKFYIGAYKAGVSKIEELDLKRMLGQDAQVRSISEGTLHFSNSRDGDLGNTVLKILIAKDNSPAQISCGMEMWDDSNLELEYMVSSMLALRVQCYDVNPIPSKKSEIHPELFIP